MSKVSWILRLFLACFFLVGVAKAEEPLGVAVFPFGAKGGAPSGLAEALTGLFNLEMQNAGGVRLIEEDMIRDLARQAALEQQCGSESCQVDLARQVHADVLVRGELLKIGSNYYLTAALVDLKTKSTSYTDKVHGQEGALPSLAEELARRMAAHLPGRKPAAVAKITVEAVPSAAPKALASRPSLEPPAWVLQAAKNMTPAERKKSAVDAYNKGVLLSNDSDQERRLYIKAIGFDPDLGSAYLNLGLLAYRAGDWQGAIQSLEKFMELEPGDPDASKIKTYTEDAREKLSGEPAKP